MPPLYAASNTASQLLRHLHPPTAAPVSLPTPATDTFPWDKHDALLMNSEEYRGSWNRTRRDIKDRSASGFDMSLACITAQAGFTDSEIIAVLMAARRKHGDHQQVKHPGYYATTLTKARKLGTVVDQTTDEEPTREQALANLAADLNIPIVNVQLMVSETMPYYLFRFEGGQLIEVPSDAVVTQLTFRRCIFRALHRTPSKISEKQSKSSPLCWDDYVNMIGELGESDPLDSGPNASREGVLLAALEHWFENGNRPVELPPGDVMAPDQPFLRDGKVWFRIDPLLRSLQMTAYRDLTREDIRHRLLRLDAESRKFNVMGRTQRGQADGRRSSKSFWGLPWDDETGLSS
ncbi:MAG: hypothetical protein BWY79_01546 [Actinobacteria bacterium ADurb.Bin444]|nr:MAG: hypothetical protein BWY79_01546 [Actinobacteria bacterium ADurb.Bin444]